MRPSNCRLPNGNLTTSVGRRCSSGRNRLVISCSSSSSSSSGTSRQLAASGAMVGLAALAFPLHQLLSSLQLPSVQQLLHAGELTAGCAATFSAGALGAAQLLHGDTFHLEVHRGRVYVQLGVPASGPRLAPGSVVTRPTGDVRGNGAYAAAPVAAGTHIADYSGELLDRAAFFDRYPDGMANYAMGIDQEYVIDAAAHVADTSCFHPVHMNHSRGRANVVRFYERSKRRVAFFAMRDIHVGEELLYDYGRAYWRSREALELP